MIFEFGGTVYIPGFREDFRSEEIYSPYCIRKAIVILLAERKIITPQGLNEHYHVLFREVWKLGSYARIGSYSQCPQYESQFRWFFIHPMFDFILSVCYLISCDL